MWIKLAQSPIGRVLCVTRKVRPNAVQSPTVSDHRPPNQGLDRTYDATASVYLAQQFWVMILGSKLAQLLQSHRRNFGRKLLFVEIEIEKDTKARTFTLSSVKLGGV
jgi:hypothetical protein